MRSCLKCSSLSLFSLSIKVRDNLVLFALLGQIHVVVCARDDGLDGIVVAHHRDADCRAAGYGLPIFCYFTVMGNLQEAFCCALDVLWMPQVQQAHEFVAAPAAELVGLPAILAQSQPERAQEVVARRMAVRVSGPRVAVS